MQRAICSAASSTNTSGSGGASEGSEPFCTLSSFDDGLTLDAGEAYEALFSSSPSSEAVAPVVEAEAVATAGMTITP